MTRQGQLFSMDPLPPPPGQGRGGKKKWGGRIVAKARDYCRETYLRAGPTLCWRGCGRVITLDWPEKDWHAGHVDGRAEGGADEYKNFRPECRWCNTSAGGKLGAAITNGRKVTVDTYRERTLKWW